MKSRKNVIENNLGVQAISPFRFFASMLLVCALCLSCSKKESKAPAEEPARPVRTMTLRGPAQYVVKVYPAKTDAEDTSDSAFEVSGKIIELPVERGMKVVKGQVLAKLDARDYENELAAKKAEEVKAQAELERYRSLYEDDVVSLQDLQIRERDLSVAEANRKKAEKAVQDTILRAPFAGVVATKYADNFQSVLEKTPIVRIQNNEAIQAVIHIPERDMVFSGKKAIQKATVEFDAFRDRKFDLTLKEFEAEADPVTQTFKVKFTLPNPQDLRILPGMSARVTLYLTPAPGTVDQQGFVVPSAAVVPSAIGKPFVWAVDLNNKTVHKREVVLGQITGTADVQITGGLAQGDMIAVSGIYQLRDGMKIQPKEIGTEMVK